jgi:hypothetical protein
MTIHKMPFTNIQQELLRLYAHQVADTDLIEIKNLIGNYFAKRLSQMADVAWEKNNWSDEDMEAILNDPNQ